MSFYLKGKEKWSGSGEQYRFKESCFISSLQHAFMLIGLIQEKRKYWWARNKEGNCIRLLLEQEKEDEIDAHLKDWPQEQSQIVLWFKSEEGGMICSRFKEIGRFN